MATIPARFEPSLLSLMRIAVAFVFVEHGTQKLFAFPGPPIGALGSGLLLFTGVLETAGGTLLTLGLFTRIAAFLLSGEMAVGYWWMHAPVSLYPLLNGGEAMAVYSFVFLFLAAAGGGPFSLDAALKRA